MSALDVPIPPSYNLLHHANRSAAPPLPSSRLNALNGPVLPTSPKQMMGTPLSRPQKSIPPRLDTATTCM